MLDADLAEAPHVSEASRVEEIFFRVVDLAPGERARVLEEHCPDGDSRAEVERLLAAEARAPADFLAGSDPSAPEVMGERIGPYRILERLGEGGMGTVYAARQSFPEREVALKVLRSGQVSAQAIRRFRHEIDILGRLQHTGIARIYDAGSVESPAADGAPRELHYFTMELVRGVPLLRYARENDLGRPQRIELLARTCDAVHYAHQRGVIHRDLKSENVLVTKEESTAYAESGDMGRRVVGQPKVLDFGIARLVDPGLEGMTRQTREGALLGTLGSMSPEQVSGDAQLVDVRTDVYALGVMLYELLCDRSPIPLEGLGVPQAIQRILEQDPTPPEALDPELRGDLNTIALKALVKDPARRYQTAADLAADLRSYLRGEPISARSDSRLYVLRRSIRRHRWMVAFSATVALLVGAFALASLRQARIQTALAESEAEARRQAEADYNRALEAVDLLTELGSSGLVDIPQAEPARRALLQASLGFYRDLLAEHPDEGDLSGRQARARVLVAELLDALGERDEASEELGRAIVELEDQLDPQEEPALETRMSHLTALALEGAMLLRDGDAETALARLEHCVALADELEQDTAAEHPEREAVLERYAYAYRQLAECLEARGLRDEAVELARGTFERLEEETSADRGPELEGQLLALLQTATVHRLSSNPSPDLEPDLLRLIEGYRALHALEPATGDDQEALVSLLTNYAAALSRWGRPEEAAEQLALAIEMGEELFESHPDLLTTSGYLFNAYHNRGNYRAKAGDLAGAEADLDRATELLERRMEVQTGIDSLAKRAYLENTRATLLVRQERYEEAIDALMRSRESAEEVLASLPAHTPMRRIRRFTIVNHGTCSIRLGDPVGAIMVMDEMFDGAVTIPSVSEACETLWIWRSALEQVHEASYLNEEERDSWDEACCDGALEYLQTAERNGFRGWSELRASFEWGDLLEHPPLAELVDRLAAE